ncbi:efflux RND transporter periplasmic adaptor subunit [Thermosynechococcaceae cyanobacterium BACA0444]|uniref:Efflux RND transporter periplasmic adaptor subunit n=1 Tax=Pseudocalidococcus azoricus BACA0444 TaxID=2918990 RepID=A0AAE4FVK8_9CYAN|nr:efflux RND transporter periplasmic adaptor subunit [Pseudocalidococcus azoricus]MDS3861730.1 efflux RND transporter periplasmic adaptor subunit [Pseudocalidococcus azoricus BACA0444]
MPHWVKARLPHQPLSLALMTLLLLYPSHALGHAGHGDEFSQTESAQSANSVKLEPDIKRRLGIAVQPVQQRPLPLGIKTTGTVETLPNQSVTVTMPVGGTLVKLLVNPGQAVNAGQPLAIMSSPELAETSTQALDRKNDAIAALNQAQAELALAQENYRQQQIIAQQEIAEARSVYELAQESNTRDQELVVAGALPRRQSLASASELAKAQAALSRAESRLNVRSAATQLKQAQAQVKQAQQQIVLSERTYQTRLRQLGTQANADGTIRITAPIVGVVTLPDAADRRVVRLGESRQDAGEPILQVVNTSRVQVRGNLYEKDLGQVEIGQQVEGQASSLPNQQFQGRVTVIDPVVAGESRAVPVVIELNNTSGQLRPGMFVNLEILTGTTPKPVLVVPTSAVVETNDKRQIVFVENGAVYEPVEVETGRRAGNWVEITSGLFAGDLVVTERANQLYTQSLRGNKEPEAAAETHDDAALPWWIFVLAGLGVIGVAGGMFWAGLAWATRQERKRQALTPPGLVPEYLPKEPRILEGSHRE